MANEETSPEQAAVPPKLNLKAKVAAPQKDETPPAAENKPEAAPPAETKSGPSLNLAAAVGLDSDDKQPAAAASPQPAAAAPAATPKPIAVTPPAPAVTGNKPLTIKPPAPAAQAGPKPLTIKPPAAASPATPKPLAVKPPATAAPATPKPLGGPAAVAIKPPTAAPAATAQGPEDDGLSQTMEIKMPPTPLTAGGPKKKETSRIPLEVAKRQTSRIPLDSAKQGDMTRGPAATDAPKTIRIKPATASQGAAPVSPIAAKAETSNLEAAKRKTSRISLESAMQSGQEDEGGPKTIRLKRPSEAPTIKVAKPPAAATAALDTAAKGQTARIDIPDEDAEPDVSPTRKKTIRVKRPSGTSEDTGPKEIKHAKGSPAEKAALAAANLPIGEPEPHGAFSFFAIAAIFICIACIYLFCSQAFGPNISLTQLSYGAPELDLPWPGKLGR